MAQVNAADEYSGSVSSAPRRRFWLIAMGVILALATAYWFLIRTTYEPILTNVAPTDAADIVKVLDAKKILYTLADGGRTIQVSSDQADKARIDLMGSELPMRGQVGFELFNQSDMGLTEFAQKINYQRALQGELARTILLLDGIESVRVHLALPDHSLFRDDQTPPKASVTLILKPGIALKEGTVSGIQRLVAGSVPDLNPQGVSVLDGSGRVVSRDEAPAPAPDTNSDAIVQSYRRQIMDAITAATPELHFDVNVSLRYLASPAVGAPTEETAAEHTGGKATAPTPRGTPDYALSVRITTRQPLEDGQRADLTRIVESSVGFAATRGDTVAFLVGPLVTGPTSFATQAGAERIVARSLPDPVEERPVAWIAYWPWLAALAVLLLGLAFANDRRRARLGRRDQLASFAEELRDRLAASGRPAA